MYNYYRIDMQKRRYWINFRIVIKRNFKNIKISIPVIQKDKSIINCQKFKYTQFFSEMILK